MLPSNKGTSWMWNQVWVCTPVHLYYQVSGARHSDHQLGATPGYIPRKLSQRPKTKQTKKHQGCNLVEYMPTTHKVPCSNRGTGVVNSFVASSVGDWSTATTNLQWRLWKKEKMCVYSWLGFCRHSVTLAESRKIKHDYELPKWAYLINTHL